MDPTSPLSRPGYVPNAEPTAWSQWSIDNKEDKDPDKWFVPVHSARNREEKALKPGTMQKVAKVLAKHQKAGPKPERKAKETKLEQGRIAAVFFLTGQDFKEPARG